MNRMIHGIAGFLKHSLLLCLCAVLLCSAACAETIIDLGLPEGGDGMGYEATLPDGRLVFSGCNSEAGNSMNSKARLLCLNPDGTTSWDYIYPQEGCCSFFYVNVLKDGTLAVLFRDAPYQETKEEKLVFFTMDGQPTGKETKLEEDAIGGILTTCFFAQKNDPYDEAERYIRYSDVNGDLLFQINGSPQILALSLIEEEDGLVLIGREPGLLANAAGKIMKIDLQGNTVWETTMPFLMEVNEGVTMEGIKTGDGCYVAVLQERGPDSGSPDCEWKYALVKFSSTGRVLWMNQESFDKRPEKGFEQVVEYKGKYVVVCSGESSLDSPVQYLWFDTDGNELGVTEQLLRKQDLPGIGHKKNLTGFPGRLIPSEGGLWQDYFCWCDESTHEKEMASQDDFLVRVPEL